MSEQHEEHMDESYNLEKALERLAKVLEETRHNDDEWKRNLSTCVARVDERTKHMDEDFRELKDSLSKEYVTRAEFRPVRLLVYGFVGIMLSALTVSLLYLVLK